MRMCAKCHKKIKIWQPYYIDKRSSNEYHVSCKPKNVELLNETIVVPPKDIKKSSVPYVDVENSRFIGTLIIGAVAVIGQYLYNLKNTGTSNYWIGLILLGVGIVIYIIIKLVLYYTSYRMSSHTKK